MPETRRSGSISYPIHELTFQRNTFVYLFAHTLLILYVPCIFLIPFPLILAEPKIWDFDFKKEKKKLRRIKIKTNVLFSVFFFSSFSLCWKTDKTERKSEPFDSILWHIFSCFVHLFCSFAISAVLFKLQRFWWRFLYILCFVCIRY